MKEQYVGDINDYRKYTLLRLLAATGLKLGVCWMLTPSDGRADGQKISYLQNPKAWRGSDPYLFDTLAACVGSDGERSLARIEASGILPRASYFNEFTPDPVEARKHWFSKALEFLRGSDLIFFDPDNGLDVPSVKKGARNSSKYLYRDEVAETFELGHSLLIYQHFPRENRSAFISRIGTDLSALCPMAALSCFPTAHVAFFLVSNPKHRNVLVPTDLAPRWTDAIRN